MNVLFLILNYKTYSDTILLTKELLSEETTLDYGILIVDNNSQNNSFRQIKEVFGDDPRVEVIESNENGGYAKGNNIGLRYAKKYNPDFVCIINNDVHFTMRTIEHLSSLYDTLPNAAIISPIQLLPGNESARFKEMQVLHLPTMWDDLRSYSVLFEGKTHEYKENTNIAGVQKVDMIPGAFLFIRYNVFSNIGFFDETTFLFGEERILAKRIKDTGLNNYIILNEYYIHAHSKTINQEASRKRQAEYVFKGKILYTKRYRKYPLIKSSILYIAYKLNRAYLWLRKK